MSNTRRVHNTRPTVPGRLFLKIPKRFVCCFTIHQTQPIISGAFVPSTAGSLTEIVRRPDDRATQENCRGINEKRNKNTASCLPKRRPLRRPYRTVSRDAGRHARGTDCQSRATLRDPAAYRNSTATKCRNGEIRREREKCERHRGDEMHVNVRPRLARRAAKTSENLEMKKTAPVWQRRRFLDLFF